MAKNRLLCLDEVFFIILNKKVYKYKHIVYIIIMNLTKEKKMDELTIKAEKIISDIFNGKYISFYPTKNSVLKVSNMVNLCW